MWAQLWRPAGDRGERASVEDGRRAFARGPVDHERVEEEVLSDEEYTITVLRASGEAIELDAENGTQPR